MNGGEQKIFDAIHEVKNELTVIATKQEERHVENTKHLDKIDGKIAEMQEKPCKNKDAFSTDIKRLYVWVWAIAIMLMGTAIKVLAFSG